MKRREFSGPCSLKVGKLLFGVFRTNTGDSKGGKQELAGRCSLTFEIQCNAGEDDTSVLLCVNFFSEPPRKHISLSLSVPLDVLPKQLIVCPFNCIAAGFVDAAVSCWIFQ